MSLNAFLTSYAPALTHQILEQFAPLYTPTAEARQALSIPDLTRPLFDAQKDTVLALQTAFAHYRAVGIAGEPGIGKTFTSLALARSLDLKRILVLCPPHLVEEWREEVERSLVHCPAYIIERIGDLEQALATSRHIQAPLQVFILSHSRAKLRYYWTPAVWTRRWKVVGELVTQLRCPSCGQEPVDAHGAALALADFTTVQRPCPSCHSALWQPDRTRRRLFPLAVYIKRKCSGVFDLLVADEAHEYKAQGTAQALAFHNLMQACPRTVALTGTLSSGKASDFFPLLYRLSPQVRARYGQDQVLHFVRDFGILEQVTHQKQASAQPQADEEEDGIGSIRKGVKSKVYERPGLSPAIVPLLLNTFVFLRLADIAHALPGYGEFVHPLPLPHDIAEAYRTLERQAVEWCHSHRGASLAQFLHGLLSYPDQPWEEEALTAMELTGTGSTVRVSVAQAPTFSVETIYPKEAKLLEILQDEQAHGRKVLVFVIHTDKRDMIPRLTGLAEQHGLKLAALRSGGPARDRKRELRRLLERGADGIVCHPRLVQTGLNLLEFPTLVFYQFDYSTFTLRQASRRSFRPSQTQAVEVHFLCYQETVQEKGLALMARKLRAALMAEGEFVDAGLSAFADDSDVTRELTRCLLDGQTVPGLEETFRALQERPSQPTGSAYLGAAPAADREAERPGTVSAIAHSQNISPPAPASFSPSDPAALQRLDDLRAQKKVLDARRSKRLSVKKTLSGNPGQLSLFGE